MELFSRDDIELVYVDNVGPFSETRGTTHVCTRERSYVSGNVMWYDVTLLTDGGRKVTVSADRVVSERPYVRVSDSSFYHFSRDGRVEGTCYVLKETENAVSTTSRSSFGSGVYGKYTFEEVEGDDAVVKITLENPYLLQDREHGESLTAASVETNKYVDRILRGLREVEEGDLGDLLTLWNVVFYRTSSVMEEYGMRSDMMDGRELDHVLTSYVSDYLSYSSLDGYSKEVFVLPVNYVLSYLGYDGVMSYDAENNGWDRGCVSFEGAEVIRGEKAKY